MNQQRKVIAVTGPSPGVGKTFLSVNLAYMVAQAGKRVSRDGDTIERAACAVTWGAAGTNAQHSFFQLLHQGTELGELVTQLRASIALFRGVRNRRGAEDHLVFLQAIRVLQGVDRLLRGPRATDYCGSPCRRPLARA